MRLGFYGGMVDGSSDLPVPQSPQKLLLLQIGPVQDFIAQARSTRDLWSGSFLISYMAARSMQWLRTRFPGQVKFVFPCMRDEEDLLPTLRWLEQESARTSELAKDALLPSIPNRLFATVPEECTAETLKTLVREIFSAEAGSRWSLIADACREWLSKEAGQPFGDEEIWAAQVAAFWQTSWQLSPLIWDEEEARQAFNKTGVGAGFAGASPDGWMMNYHTAAHALDARRQTRNFNAWEGLARRHKDAFSGREEALVWHAEGTEKRSWWQQALEDSESLRQLFRSTDSLGAISLIKRVWHLAYLMKQMGFDKLTQPVGDTWFNMPSILGIAAYPWARAVYPQMADKHSMAAFLEAVDGIASYAEVTLASRGKDEPAATWLKRVDWQVFQFAFWDEQLRLALNPEHAEAARRGRVELQFLLKEAKCGSPGRYYAVLVMDGDGIGAWLSGKKLRPGQKLSRDLHEKLSLGLAEATLGASKADRISTAQLDQLDQPEAGSREKGMRAQVEETPSLSRFHGKLIYAGADDVVALLPAEDAIRCARAISRHFCGVMSKNSQQGQEGAFAAITISAGIAIGHIKEPVQDLLKTAFEDLKRAKRRLGGDALALTLYKRSGETLRWGTGFKSASLSLLDYYQSHATKPPQNDAASPPISGRFPHRLTELLQRYASDDRQPMSQTLCEIAEAEFAHVVKQHTDKDFAGRDQLRLLAKAYLTEMTQWKADPEKPDLDAPQISDFYHLFQIEAFISRQDD